jgi:glycosyltransferase involved in cell wall biosynthesis
LRTKVAYLDQTAQLGGAEIALLNLLQTMDRSRWNPIALLGSSGPLCDQLVHEGIAVRTLLLSPGLASVRQSAFDTTAMLNPVHLLSGLSYSVRLAATLRRLHIGLLHLNSLKVGFLGGLAGRLARIPTVWQVHSVMAEPIMSRQAAQMVRVFARWVPNAIVCNSRATAFAIGQLSTKVVVIPCGVRSESLAPRPHSNGLPRVGMVARFAPIKGQHVFLDAAERLATNPSSPHFVVAGKALFGEDGYETTIRKRAGCGTLAGRVDFPGFVANVPALLHTLDVVVHPSVEPEGFGQIVAEAMMAGKPIVASSAGGTAELLEDGVTGRLVPPGDAAALAAAIDELLGNPAKAAEMGMRAREVALDKYDISKTTRAIEDVYEKVLAKS